MMPVDKERGNLHEMGIEIYVVPMINGTQRRVFPSSCCMVTFTYPLNERK